MRVVLIVLPVLAAFAIGSYAEAQTYPWCALYTKDSASCSFVTLEQCMADVSGIGGFCQKNDWYKPTSAVSLQHKPHNKH
jgi:Protein of unknown function (DUF3551)